MPGYIYNEDSSDPISHNDTFIGLVLTQNFVNSSRSIQRTNTSSAQYDSVDMAVGLGAAGRHPHTTTPAQILGTRALTTREARQRQDHAKITSALRDALTSQHDSGVEIFSPPHRNTPSPPRPSFGEDARIARLYEDYIAATSYNSRRPLPQRQYFAEEGLLRAQEAIRRTREEMPEESDVEGEKKESIVRRLMRRLMRKCGKVWGCTKFPEMWKAD